ncbi:ABC transporter ATP-binding protein [Litchfieldia salsa]|uniref:Carnitine transport ATP-binding protein OpuCA n=1 Tax=Litchfieldia salsa TaxID=930152 RepID=A0A1H0S2C1_9BACI|nr:ABC transporter ATP-binding protein [Litchfieldia salsa]SDP35749.1 NitT/TauT family transport system ATP-binding protein [Litchfieldia salsa]
MFLQFTDVSKQYTNQNVVSDVLRNINVSVNEGEFVSILGPSGCGKSTLLSMVAGLVKPTTGEILLQGNPIKKPGKERGMVFQQAALFPWLSVEENVMFPLKKEIGKKEAIEVAHKYLSMVQLGNYLKHSPHELSGGMQQRVAIARALAMNPTVLLMDEPFGALDEQTRSRLHIELEKIWLETKKTILFVTHSIKESIMLSDRILVMGTRPGIILEDIKVEIPRPRATAREEIMELETKISNLLEKEIEKVVKEELAYASN